MKYIYFNRYIIKILQKYGRKDNENILYIIL